MLRVRVIPALLLYDGSLVKTIQFDKINYVGDPINTVRIFNDLEVDEIVVLDILASLKRRSPDFSLVELIASHCFMPLSYGGGIRSIGDAKRIFSLGVEKIIINHSAVSQPEFIGELSGFFGAQSIVVSIDVMRNSAGEYDVYTLGKRERVNVDLMEYVEKMQSLGVGEILLTSIDREGMWEGYDVELLKMVASAVNIPVIAHGGAGGIGHFQQAIRAGASAVAAGSMFVYLKRDSGVLINFPSRDKLKESLENGKKSDD